MDEFFKNISQHHLPKLRRTDSRFEGLADESIDELSDELTDEEQELQSRIDRSLSSRFDFQDAAMPAEFVQQLENRQLEVRRAVFNRRTVIASLVAALVTVSVYASWQLASFDNSPFFKPRSLVTIFEECVERGYKPSFLCENADRVEGNFLYQNGVPLDLTELESGKDLIGISHLGGLSRNTFAVLFEFDGSPVMVFIDSHKFDDSAATVLPSDTDLNIFSSRCGEFVLYEVSTMEDAEFLPHLVLPTSR